MTREEREQAITILENEKKCVNRANKNDYCNRDCYNCELVKTDTEILTALDMAIQALKQSMPTMVYPQVDGITPTVVAQADGEKTCGTCRNEDTYHCAECENKSDYEQSQADGEKSFKMRDATPEEQEAIDKYIKSISKPTGVNVFDFYEDEEQEQIDFVQPKKKIPCTIKAQADGEYILKKDVMGCIGQTSLHWELARKLRKLPSVAIPSAEPKTGHWIEQIDHEENCRTLICSNCDRPALHDGDSIWKHKFCPHCGAKMD